MTQAWARGGLPLAAPSRRPGARLRSTPPLPAQTRPSKPGSYFRSEAPACGGTRHGRNRLSAAVQTAPPTVRQGPQRRWRHYSRPKGLDDHYRACRRPRALLEQLLVRRVLFHPALPSVLVPGTTTTGAASRDRLGGPRRCYGTGGHPGPDPAPDRLSGDARSRRRTGSTVRSGLPVLRPAGGRSCRLRCPSESLRGSILAIARIGGGDVVEGLSRVARGV